MQRNWYYYLGVLLTIALAAIAVFLAKVPFITTLHLSPLISVLCLGLSSPIRYGAVCPRV